VSRPVTRWHDLATGLVVDFMVLSLAYDPGRGDSNRLPAPIDGPQFCVTYHGFVEGTARTAGELAALGVSAECIARIERAAGVTAPGLGGCEADGYTLVGTMGDELYWHCEDPAVVTDPEGLKLCARHAEGYWPDLIPGLLP
jgi:hypothetical protein